MGFYKFIYNLSVFALYTNRTSRCDWYSAKKAIINERRQGKERRQSTGSPEKNPILRAEDWDKIDSELKN
jgi:hypothetical protein